MRTWFITGASRGFGELIAKKALEAGDNVVAAARKTAGVAERFGNHPNLLPVQLDVTNEAQAHQAVAEAIKRFGQIDILVNNAGYGLLGAVEEASREEIEPLFATNVFGVLNITRAVLPHMRRRRSGHIINISSIGGYQAYQGWGVYGATKFAVEGLSEALHQELQPLGIHVTVVEPGFFRTDFLDSSSLAKSTSIIDDYADTVGTMRNVAGDMNHAQPGNPIKLAEAFIKLADAKQPPQRLPLGSDTIARIEQKNRQVADELAQWRDLALSTDFTTV